MRYVRTIFVLLLAAGFLSLAYLLHEKQQNTYSFMSFRLETPNHALVVPDLDRMLRKLNDATSMAYISENETLKTGLQELISHKNHRFNDDLGEACFVSFNGTDFTVVFSNPDLSYGVIENKLSEIFGLAGSYEEGKFQLGNHTFHTGQYGQFTVFSTQVILPEFDVQKYRPTNADYFVLNDSISTDRYILTNGQEFKVWNKIDAPVRGRPVVHENFVHKVPREFDDLYFYGSERFQEDKMTFFSDPGEEAFSWVGNGMLILKKDSFELILAPQNDQRDLRLILEEQTMVAQGDSGVVNSFNIKNFEIMPFQTAFNWQDAITEIETAPAYYTEYENFNVLSNSVNAMQWYLSEIQIGNLLAGDANFLDDYALSLPFKSHYLHIAGEEDGMSFESSVWADKIMRTYTQTQANLAADIGEETSGIAEFDIALAPNFMMPVVIKGKTKLLLVNDKEMALYNLTGNQEWKVTLGNAPLKAPEIIDLENDGNPEITITTKNSFIVYNSSGKNIEKLTLNFYPENELTGSLIVNYDKKFDYRFFLIYGYGPVCYNELGKKVEGWQFKGVSGGKFNGKAYYTQVNGKDYLSFTEKTGKQHLFSRRGEYRFSQPRKVDVRNQSDFIVGTNEVTLRVLGYDNQYIYNAYLRDESVDSIKLDKRVNAISARWERLDKPTLVIEEPGRIILFNEFGYVEQEILKPQNASTFVGVEFVGQLTYVFFDNSNNSLYLLNRDGKQILTNPSKKSSVYGINATRFYTYDGQKIKEHKLN